MPDLSEQSLESGFFFFMTELINREKTETKEERDKRRRERELSDIRAVIKTPEGRRLYWRFIEAGRMFKVEFSGDVNWLVFQTGMKKTSEIFLGDLLEAKPEAFIQMQKEHASESESEGKRDQEEQKNKDILETSV